MSGGCGLWPIFHVEPQKALELAVALICSQKTLEPLFDAGVAFDGLAYQSSDLVCVGYFGLADSVAQECACAHGIVH